MKYIYALRDHLSQIYTLISWVFLAWPEPYLTLFSYTIDVLLLKSVLILYSSLGFDNDMFQLNGPMHSIMKWHLDEASCFSVLLLPQNSLYARGLVNNIVIKTITGSFELYILPVILPPTTTILLCTRCMLTLFYQDALRINHDTMAVCSLAGMNVSVITPQYVEWPLWWAVLLVQ